MAERAERRGDRAPKCECAPQSPLLVRVDDASRDGGGGGGVRVTQEGDEEG